MTAVSGSGVPVAASPSPAATTAAPTPSSSPTPSAAVSGVAVTAAERAPIVVLNGSGVSKAGARAADALRAKGWKVTKVADYKGSLKTTTVFYPRDKKDAARALKKQFDAVTEMELRKAGMSRTALTLVITKEIAG